MAPKPPNTHGKEGVTRFRLTPAAQRDLSSIWDFSAETWNIDQAESYIDGIRAASERVAEDRHL